MNGWLIQFFAHPPSLSLSRSLHRPSPAISGDLQYKGGARSSRRLTAGPSSSLSRLEPLEEEEDLGWR